MSFQEPNIDFFVDLNERIRELQKQILTPSESAETNTSRILNLNEILQFKDINQPFISKESVLREIEDLESQLLIVPSPTFKTECRTLGFPEQRTFCNEVQTNTREIQEIRSFNNNINSEIAQRNRFLSTLTDSPISSQNNNLPLILLVGLGVLLL